MSSSKVPKNMKTPAEVEDTKEGVEKSDSSSSDSSSDRKTSADKVKEKTPRKSKGAVAADESPSLEKYGGWIQPLTAKKVAGAENESSSAAAPEESNKIVHEEETPEKSSPPPPASSSEDRPELPKRRISTPHKKVGYKKKKQQQLKRKIAADHRRRASTLDDDQNVDGGACCRHCCCCRCHDVISYSHGETAGGGRRNVEAVGRRPARLDKKRSTPKETKPMNGRNTTPSPLRAERRQLMEGQIEDDCFEDVRLASVIVNRGEECFRKAVAECGVKPKVSENIDKATNLKSQEP